MPQGEFAIFFKRRWPVAVPLAAVFLFSAYVGLREFWRWYGINQEYVRLQEEAVLSQNESETLRRELADLSRPAALEKEARAKLNLKKQGEAMLVVVSEDDFPEENFALSESRGLWAALKKLVLDGFENPNSIWFNIKNWLNYFNPK